MPRLIAVATQDPLDPTTFSGYSRRLFNEVISNGWQVERVATRDLHWYDAVTGAVGPSAIWRRAGDRQHPLVRPNWLWSRRGFERACRRFDHNLARLSEPRVLLQVGTHVRTRLPQTVSYCVTDATIPQALEAGEFSISRASARVQAEAIECQSEVLHSCEKVFVLSEWAAASVRDDFGVEPGRVVVLGAGANLDRVLPRQVDDKAPYILFVGADWSQKGGPLLLEALRIARRTVPDLRLVVVGCEPDIDEPGVEVVGFLARSDPDQHQRFLDLYAGALCFSILPVFDAYPNVLLEAARFGVPVVSTTDGSRPEAVVDGVTGLLAPTRDAAEVAARIVSLAESPALTERLGTAAQQRALEKYTWEGVGQRLLAHLQQPVS